MAPNIISTIFGIFGFRQKMGLWTPHLLQIYFQNYKETLLLFPNMFFLKFDDLNMQSVESLCTEVFEFWNYNFRF